MAISKKKNPSKINSPKIPKPDVMSKRKLLSVYEQRISLHVENYLTLNEKGDLTQIVLALHKAKMEYKEFGPEMEKIAALIGGNLPEIVGGFLDSIDSILYLTSEWAEEELISQCLNSTSRLIAELKEPVL